MWKKIPEFPKIEMERTRQSDKDGNINVSFRV